VQSTVGEGTRFTIYLPAKKDQTGRVDAALVPQAPVESAQKSGRVLIMDDEEPIQRYLARALKRLGYESVGAIDGDQAVGLYRDALASEKPFDIVILDLTIRGGIGGREALAALRQLDPAVVAVASSGYSNDPVMANFQEHGFKAVLPKPFGLEELKGLLAQVARPSTAKAPRPAAS
jgi:CheY-like chemotaxis protein